MTTRWMLHVQSRCVTMAKGVTTSDSDHNSLCVYRHSSNKQLAMWDPKQHFGFMLETMPAVPTSVSTALTGGMYQQ